MESMSTKSEEKDKYTKDVDYEKKKNLYSDIFLSLQ